MSIQSISNTRFGYTHNPVHNLGMLAITIIALNAIQNIPTTQAAFISVNGVVSIVKTVGYPIVFVPIKIYEWFGGLGVSTKAVENVVDSVARYGTFKYVGDKICDASFLAAPQFAIPFRVAMTAGSLGIEWWACHSASEAYLRCVDQQVKSLNECGTIQTNALNNKVNACSQITDSKDKDTCIKKSIEDFNAQSVKTSPAKNALADKCLAVVPSCTVLWLQRDLTCVALGGHAALSAGRLAWELALATGKASILPSLKIAVAVADTAIQAVT